ncbi:MAG: quinone-dependent dihydroorotate dehydrogenase, partial [Calditrichaeota bacterium]
GFGFIEIGTVTPRAQPGNPKPRIFRLVEEEALINRMGFNNQGADEIAARLKSRSPDVIIGGNIGKNRNTPNEHAVDDYLLCFEKLYDVVDFFIVNVSSPNTPHLRELQEREPLKRIMASLMERSAGKKPILLKIAPDLNNEQLDDIIDIIQETGINGIVATNTTISRDGLHTPEEKVRMLGEGGLSGKPLKARATEVIKYLRERLDPDFPIIGAGGIHSPGDAIEKLKAGANLVELYTGFIYEGPGLLKKIKKTLLKNTNLY